VPVAQAVVDQDQQFAATATLAMLRPRRAAICSRVETSHPAVGGSFCTASTAAQRTRVAPCLSVAPEMSTPRVSLFWIFFGGGWVRRGGGWGPGSGAARPRSGRRAWMPTPGLADHRRHCGEDHSAADHRRGMITPGGGWACSPVSGCVGRPCLSGCSATEGPATRWRSGCLDGCGRSFLVGCSGARAGSNRVAGS